MEPVEVVSGNLTPWSQDQGRGMMQSTGTLMLLLIVVVVVVVLLLLVCGGER